MTDKQDTDKGYFDNNKVSGQFGDVTDTAWHTVEFQAKVKSGQNGNKITNVAQVTGDNVEKSNNPSTDVGVINHKPSAPDDHKTTSKDTPVSGQVKGSDPDGDPLTYKEGKSPSHGTVEVHEDGTWTYTPDKGYTGKDSFTVIVDDGNGGKIEVPVTVDITEPENPPKKPNNPPTAKDDHKTTSKDTPVSGQVKGSDPDGDPLTYKEGKSPSHGTVEVHKDGTWTYTPNKGYTGKDSFTVIVDDGKGGKIEVPVTVDITEPENPPTKPNNPPIISGPKDTTIHTGNHFDPYEGITATDKEDGNITDKTKIVKNTVNVKQPGTYEVVYKVTDSDGNTSYLHRKVIVENSLPKTGDTNDLPTILGGLVLLLAACILSFRLKRRKDA